jgi:hypothetical protein
MVARDISVIKKKGLNIHQRKSKDQFDFFDVDLLSDDWRATSDPFVLTDSTGTTQQTLESNVDFDLFLQYYEDAD